MNEGENIKKSILVSVLNWNAADETLKCVQSLLELDEPKGFKLHIVVIDNGSADADRKILEAATQMQNLQLVKQSTNLGFAGGHNISIQIALDQDYDYVWLLNNDAITKAPALNLLFDAMEKNPKYGAVSPLILAREDQTIIDFCGSRHDWKSLEIVTCTSVEQAKEMEQQYPRDMWLMGAAILLRTSALRQIGMLDDKLFAYYEDNDLCVRLSENGWFNKMVFDAVVLHKHPKSRMEEKPPYYFYLMARNSFRFWFKHTPPQYRKLLRLKLVDRTMLTANRLHYRGLSSKVDACLLGLFDGQVGNLGYWNLQRSTPFLLRFARKVLWINHAKHL